MWAGRPRSLKREIELQGDYMVSGEIDLACRVDESLDGLENLGNRGVEFRLLEAGFFQGLLVGISVVAVNPYAVAQLGGDML